MSTLSHLWKLLIPAWVSLCVRVQNVKVPEGIKVLLQRKGKLSVWLGLKPHGREMPGWEEALIVVIMYRMLINLIRTTWQKQTGNAVKKQ